jgi:hypothetical protein
MVRYFHNQGDFEVALVDEGRGMIGWINKWEEKGEERYKRDKEKEERN